MEILSGNREPAGVSGSLCGNIQDYYETGTCLITWVLLPFICVFGLVLNVLAISVFSFTIYRGQRTSMTVYLIALSVFDSIQLLFSIFIITFGGTYFLSSSTNENGEEEGVHGGLTLGRATIDQIEMIRAYATVYFYPLLMAANYGSVWVITLICVRRYFAICHPLSSLRAVKLKRAGIEVILISIGACGLNLCRFWEFSLVYYSVGNADRGGGHQNHSEQQAQSQQQVDIGMGPFRNTEAHPFYLMAMDGVLYIVLLYFVPFTIVTVLNVKIVMVIYRARRRMKSSRSSGPVVGGGGSGSHSAHHSARSSRSEHRSAFMVLAIILLFFICYTLAVAERLWSIVDTRGAVSRFGGFLNAVSNFMVNLNSTIDPLIYFLFSRGFKDICRKIHGRKKYSQLNTTNNIVGGGGFVTISLSPSLSMRSRKNTFVTAVKGGTTVAGGRSRALTNSSIGNGGASSPASYGGSGKSYRNRTVSQTTIITVPPSRTDHKNKISGVSLFSLSSNNCSSSFNATSTNGSSQIVVAKYSTSATAPSEISKGRRGIMDGEKSMLLASTTSASASTTSSFTTADSLTKQRKIGKIDNFVHPATAAGVIIFMSKDDV